jgi:class 3 adenylate cyclase
MPLAVSAPPRDLDRHEVARMTGTGSGTSGPALPDPPVPPSASGVPTVTHGFLFADLRGYTRYVDAHGDHAAADLLDRYRILVRGAVSAFRGAEIKTEGDSFYVVFDSASAAVRCGLAIVEAAAATADGPADAIHVGVGVHAGETVETAEGYVGSAVNIAARLCAQAKAGELVVSETVRSLTRTYLDVEFEPLGTRRLKGLDEPIGIDRVLPRSAAGSRSRSRRAGDQRRWLLAGVAGVVLVAVLGVAAVAVLQGARPSPTTVPSAAPAVTPAAAATIASPASATGVPGGLTTGEQALLARVPLDFQPFCRRSSPPDGSLGGDLASLRCDLPVDSSATFGADSVWYDAYSAPGLMAAADNAVFAREGLPTVGSGSDLVASDCTSGTAKVLGTWSLGITFSGVLACYPKGGAAWILWTYKGEQIAARAVRHDGDAGRLYAWWREESGFLR